MRKTWLVCLVLFISAAWLAAETGAGPSARSSSAASVAAQSTEGAEAPGSSQNPSSANADTSKSKAGSKTTVEGCLSGSGGSYTLTGNNGTTYQLQGEDSQLSKHVGQEVKVSGMPASGGTAAAAGSSGAQSLQVSKVKKVSKTCTTGNSSNPSSR